MRKLFVIILATLLLGVGVVALIETDPGYVLVSYGRYTLETSFWVGLLVLVLLILLISLALRLVYRVISGQRIFSSWLGSRKVRAAQRLTTQGIISFAEGNWVTARRQLLRGAQGNEAPLANYLLAAQSSAQLHDTDKVHEYLRAAKEAEPDAELAAELALAEIKLHAGEHQQAVAALDQSARNINRHPYTVQLLYQAYQGLGDWDALVALLPQLQKHKLLEPRVLQQLEHKAYLHQLSACTSDLEVLHATWHTVPRHLQRNVDMIEVYARQLIALDDHATADKTIQRGLKQQWSTPLVRQYAMVQCDDTARQLARAEGWLSAHPDDPQLLLCLGRLSARDKLWGKARDYYESSYRLEPSAEVCAELGRLLTALGEPKVAAAYFREGLLEREYALPQLPQPDKVAVAQQVLISS